MATKFRNSFLGFNKEDVMSYVMKTKETQNKNETTITELNKKIDELSVTVKEKEDELSILNTAVVELNKELDDFKSREAVLTKLSESIGKLYLVAQTNAKTIIDSAKENAVISETIVNDNFIIAQNAESDLSDIEAELKEKTARFTKELVELKEKLEATKNTVNNNRQTIKESETVLDELIENVDAGLKV